MRQLRRQGLFLTNIPVNFEVPRTAWQGPLKGEGISPITQPAQSPHAISPLLPIIPGPIYDCAIPQPMQGSRLVHSRHHKGPSGIHDIDFNSDFHHWACSFATSSSATKANSEIIGAVSLIPKTRGARSQTPAHPQVTGPFFPLKATGISKAPPLANMSLFSPSSVEARRVFAKSPYSHPVVALALTQLVELTAWMVIKTSVIRARHLRGSAVLAKGENSIWKRNQKGW